MLRFIGVLESPVKHLRVIHFRKWLRRIHGVIWLMVIDDRACIIRSCCFYLKKKSIENVEFVWLLALQYLENIYVVVEEVFANRGSAQQVMRSPCCQWVALTDWNKLRSPALGCWCWPSQWTGKRRNNCKTEMKWTFSLTVEFWFESRQCTSFYTSTNPLWKTQRFFCSGLYAIREYHRFWGEVTW